MSEPSPMTEAQDVPQPQEEPPAKTPLRAGWIAGAGTLESLAATVKPLAISLMDELVELAVFCPDGADVRTIPSPPMEILRYGRGSRWPFGGWRAEEMAEEVRSRKIQLLHALDVGSAPLAGRVAAEADVDYVVSSYSLGDGGRLGRLGRLPDRARAVLAASDQIHTDLAENRMIPPQRIRLLRPGVVRVPRPTCFDDPEHSSTLVAGGRMDDYDSFNAVLEAFAEVKARRYDCVFLFVGDGKAERRLRARIAQLRLESQLTFVGPQPPWQLTGILKAADIYISPVAGETVNFSALMAMAAGVPVLSVAGLASDFLKDGRTTSQFKRADAGELTMRLLSLLDDHAAARGLAENALDYLGRHHGPADASAKTADVYRSVLAEAAAERKSRRQ